MREQRQRMWQQWRRLEKRIRAKDELYDVSMLRGYGCKNDGYGELLPTFSQQLAEVLNLNASSKVLDVGSGIGFLCFDLACISGCSVKGIEIRRDIYLKSVQIAKHVSERMQLDVSFVYGDATGDSFSFHNMDVIVCCNTLWSDENNYRLLQKLCVQMRPNTRVVVLEQLGGQRYHEKSARHRNDILSSCFHLPPQKFQSEPGSVSWSANSIPFYVYTKKKIPRDMKERLERDRGNVLKAPVHRTDPHVVSFRGKKRAVVIEEGSDDDVVEIPPPKRVRAENGKKAEVAKKVVGRTTRTAAKAAQIVKEAKKKPQTKRKKIRSRLTMRRRRVNPNPKTRRAARPQTKKEEAQEEGSEYEEEEISEEEEPEEESEDEVEEEDSPIPRQTRAMARALLPSKPRTRSNTIATKKASKSISSSVPPPPLPGRTALRNFGKTTRQRSAIKALSSTNEFYWTLQNWPARLSALLKKFRSSIIYYITKT